MTTEIEGHPDLVDKAVAWDKVAEKNAEIVRLRKALSAAKGYLMNAAIDLQTGARKRTALATIEGGLKMVEEALVLREPLPSGEAAKGQSNG